MFCTALVGRLMLFHVAPLSVLRNQTMARLAFAPFTFAFVWIRIVETLFSSRTATVLNATGVVSLGKMTRGSSCPFESYMTSCPFGYWMNGKRMQQICCCCVDSTRTKCRLVRF